MFVRRPPGRHFLLLAILVASPLSCGVPGQPHGDRTVNVEADDPEMTAAIAKARQTLPEFWQLFEHSEHGETDFSLKVKITDKNGTEYFWVVDLERKDGKLFGTINNDPEVVKNVRLGKRIQVPELAISDWTYLRNGKMYGQRTLRPLLKRMPAEEAEKYKRILAEND